MTPKLTEGARLLRARLLRTGQTVPDFCETHGISRRILQRALNGEQSTFSVDFAIAIQKATDGEVHPGSWSQDTLRDAGPDEVGRLFPRHRHRTGDTAAVDSDDPAVDDEPSGPVVVTEGFSQVVGG
jgi:hypothetical protein